MSGLNHKIGKSLFYALQVKVLLPIVAQAWKINQASVIDALYQVGSVDLCGDGSCHSQVWHIYLV